MLRRQADEPPQQLLLARMLVHQRAKVTHHAARRRAAAGERARHVRGRRGAARLAVAAVAPQRLRGERRHPQGTEFDRVVLRWSRERRLKQSEHRAARRRGAHEAAEGLGEALTQRRTPAVAHAAARALE